MVDVARSRCTMSFRPFADLTGFSLVPHTGCRVIGQEVAAWRNVSLYDDPCLTCHCERSAAGPALTCSKKACPVLQCPSSSMQILPGECCPRCVGKRGSNATSYIFIGYTGGRPSRRRTTRGGGHWPSRPLRVVFGLVGLTRFRSNGSSQFQNIKLLFRSYSDTNPFPGEFRSGRLRVLYNDRASLFSFKQHQQRLVDRNKLLIGWKKNCACHQSAWTLIGLLWD